MMTLAQASTDVQNLFGTVAPPPGSSAFADPVTGLSKLIATGVRLFIFTAALLLLFYMLWGAFDWVLSEGDKEKVSKAQNKITNALVGFILIFIALAAFGIVTGDVLGIIKNEPGVGWTFTLPQIQ
ncbi:hypothetical protein HY214_00720 [Candidatus Roizmanbacteria bacterium]|nr:hypothetical protein [Candidatus Roizmanbacteria bacterium]